MLNSSLALEWGLDFITKGLSARAMMSFDNHANTRLQGYRHYDIYSWHVARNENEDCYYTAIRSNDDVSIHLTKDMGRNYYMNFQGSLNYFRTFAKHDVGAMALFQRDHRDGGADLPFNVIGFVGRATYGFDKRYMAEFNVGYNGTEQFAPANRFGFFPAISGGWVVSNEQFMANVPVVTHLKLRASYGKVGNDRQGDKRWLYMPNIGKGGGDIQSIGRGNRINEGLMPNEHVQWEVAEKQNYGLEIEVWKSLSLTVDMFWEERSKILIERGTVPVLQGVPLSNLPRVNMGRVDNKGYELELTYRKSIRHDFSFTVKGNYAYNENRQINVDEPLLDADYAYRYRRTGYSIDQPFCYQVDYSNGNGFINTQEELDEAMRTYQVGATPRLGDLKYIDANNDGIISTRDLVPMGYSHVPRISYGFSGTVNYRNWDFSFLLTGVAKTSRIYTGFGVTEFALAGFYTDWHLHAWTQERYANGEKILYPALGIKEGSSQPQGNNSFYLFDRSFLRLKNVELGYNLPKKWLMPVSINTVRVYVSGNNLLTWKKYPFNTVDPETFTTATYSITKLINMGLNVVF
jgi:TonB-linked SusC/RagA family outer membrane protein